MLSYRHGFHAGNFADVLKHLILQRILLHLTQKPTPICCIDTHAGAGAYDLRQAFAQKNQEYAQGIGKLWSRDDLPAVVADYVALVKSFNRNGQLIRYPGSPLIIQQLMRDKDRLLCYELHSTEIEQLTASLGNDRRSQALFADGLTASLKMLPPRERRGLVLIDPAYEIKSDYAQVVDTLQKMQRRFATGTYALWYPVVERSRNNALETAFKATGIRNCQLFELGLTPDADNAGMTASGMLVINPPWTLAQDMAVALPWLAQALGGAIGYSRFEQLTAE